MSAPPYKPYWGIQTADFFENTEVSLLRVDLLPLEQHITDRKHCNGRGEQAGEMGPDHLYALGSTQSLLEERLEASSVAAFFE